MGPAFGNLISQLQSQPQGFGNQLAQLQTQFRNTPVASNLMPQEPAPEYPVGVTPIIQSTMRPSTQQNLGLMNQLGRVGFTPNYTGLFGAMGMQPSTQMPTAPTAPTDNPQTMDQQTLIDQLMQLNLLYPKPQGYYGSDPSMINSQYWNPAQMAMWNDWQWQSQRDGG